MEGSIAVLVFGAATVSERMGNPITWGKQNWEAFKTNGVAGQEQNGYLSTSGSGRYAL
jgi:hypothetical protein